MKKNNFLTSRAFLATVIVVETIFCLFLVYALRAGAVISVGKDGFTIQASSFYELQKLRNEVKELKESSVRKGEYEDLLQRIRDLETTTINIGLLPEGSQGKKPEETIETIKTLITETRDAMGDVQFSASIVGKEVNKNWIINTSQPANKAVKKLNLNIQRVLSAIGYYSGPFDGSMEKTFRAVVDFQSRNGIKADGILGKKTWYLIRKRVEVLAPRE